MNIKKEDECPCKSGKTFGECCGPVLSGEKAAESAEAVMRARYTAYVTEQIGYLKTSAVKAVQDEFDENASLAWSRAAQWHRLQIVRSEENGDRATVEFRAAYTANGEFCNHHEVSTFVREVDGWKFEDGELIGEKPVTREEPKVGRNDPCPCGSGKKFKKCCGAGK